MTKKEYEISVRANKKSIEQLKANLTTELNNAFNNVDSAGKIKSLSRSDKAAIKADLSSLFGIADEQTEALRKMVQGIIPSDTKSIDHMKVQLQDTLKFATGIMDKMKLLGESTDWMKQGVTFVDKFVGMQSTLLETQKVVSGMQTSIDALTQSFQTFKEALAITSPGAFIDRFGAEVRSVTEDVKKAQSVIDGLRGKQNKGIKQALVVSNEDLQGYDPKMSVEDIRAAHDDIIGEISRYNKKIQELESANKGKMSSLYNNQTYQEYVHGLAVELKNLQSLQQQPLFRDAFADAGAQVGANLKAVTDEISAAAKSAGTELRQIIESLKTDGIKLSVTLPEADGAEFVAKVNDFVNKASAQFKKTPIKIGLDFANPFKSTKAVKKGTVQAKDIAGSKEVFERNATEVGVDAGNSLIGLDTKDTTKIVQGVVDSFNKIYAAVKTGQKTITEATKLWQKEMQKYLILKAKFDKTNVEDEAVAMINQLQTYLDENIPLHLGVDTDELIQEIQQALQEAKFKINIDAGNVNGKGTPINLSGVQLVSGVPVSGDYEDHITPKKSESTTTTSTSAVDKNSSAVEESTRTQRVLTDEITRLQGRIDANSETIEMSKKANEQRAENAQKNSARIEELNKNIASQQEKREEYSNQRQKHIDNRTEAEREIVANNKDYVQRSGAIRQAIKDGNIELIQQAFDSVTKSLVEEKQEVLNKLANIDVNDTKSKKKVTSYEKTIADIDSLLNSDKDQGQIVLDALYRNYQTQQQLLQAKIVSFQYNIDRLTRNIESTWAGQDAAKVEIDKLTKEAATKRSEMSIQTRQTEFAKAQKRIDNINSVLDSGQNPAVLLLDEINKFWATSSKKIAKAQEEIASLNKQLSGLKEGTTEYDQTKQAIKDQERIISSWTNRQALMSQKGLDDMRDSELEDAIRTLTEVLRRSPTLSDDLLHNDSLKGLVPIKEIAYYSGIAQNALGFKTQTDKEYVDEQTLQAKFVELFRINEFLKKINAMFPKKGAEPKLSDVEAFINFFEKIPEMSKVVESAKKYLVELKGVSELQANDATFKTLREQGLEGLYFPKKAQELWGSLDDSVRASLGQELATRGVDAKNFASLEDASDAFLQMKNLYKEGVFNPIKTDDAAFGQLITLLKQSVAIDSSSKEFKAVSDSMATVFDGKLKSILFDAINPDRPLSVRIIGSHGEESVYDIHKPGGAHLNSNRSFSTSSKSLDKFLRRSGLEDQMSRIVSAIFEDPKTAQTLIDDLFSSGKIQLATGKNAFVKKSSQSYSFGSTVLGQNLAEQERLEKEISAAKIGKYGTFLSKRLEGLSTEEQTRIINEFIANKKKELEALRRANLSEREVIQSLLTLENDIDINAAKQTAARRRSNAAKKRAKRLTEEGTDSFAYKAVLNSSKSDTFNNDYGLARLMSQIDIAGQFGLMDTSELAKLVIDYQEKYERAKQLPKRSQVPNERMGEIDAAWEEVDKARKRLINQYYETDGWYLAQVARDELTTIETEAERSRQQIQSGVTSANSSIVTKKAEIQAQESKSKQFADEYAANLYRKYILEPEEKVQVELSRRNSEIEAKKSEIATRKNDLGRQADLDKGLEALKTEIFKRQSADVELNRLLGLRSNAAIGTPEHTEYNAKIKEIEMRYAAEYNTARKAWIDGKAKELDAEYDAFIDSVKKDAGGDTTKDAIKAFNTDMKGKTTPEKSLSGIKKYIEAVKQQMYKEAEEVTRQALAGLDTSTSVPQEELDRMLRESREAATQKKQAFINSIRGKTATELMSDKKGKESIGAVGEAYEAEVALGVELKRQLKAIMDRYGITKEMLDAERNMTVLSEERVSTARQEEEVVSSAAGGASKSSGGFGTGFVSALNAANLATESTLRGIYELLNGGAPKGGWSNSNNNSTSQVKGNNGGKPVSASDSDHDIKTESDKFVSSVSQLIKTLSARTKYEGASLIGTDGKLGQIISGNEHSVPANKISSALASQVKQVLAVLHNHPSGLSSLSQGDMNAAFARAYGKGVYSGNSPVKVSGSVANGILTSINFNGIDEQVAQQIIDHYNVLLSKLPEQFGEVFKFEGGNLIVSDAIKSDPELRDGVSKILSATIKSAFEKFGYGDAFQQVSVDNVSAWKNSIIRNAQQQVAESVVESGAQVAVQAANSSNFTKKDITTRQTAFQEKFKTKELKNGKSGFDIKGANKIDQAFYNVGDRLTKDANELTDSDIKKLQTAYSQLTNGLQEDIVQHLDQDTIEFLNTLKGQISSVLDANSSRLADQTQKLESIKAAKDYLSKLKTEDGKKITGASRAITGIDWTSEILGKDSTNLKDTDLKKLALGYHKLQETVNSAIFDTLDKNTKKVINDAIREAKGVLDKYNVTMQGQELVGTVLDASNKDLFDNAAKDKTKKVGRTIKSVAEPQIMRDDRIISHASVYLGKTSKKNKTDTQAQAAAEHQVTQELQQQAQLSTEVAQQGVKAADSAERHAQAAQKVTVSKKENKAVDKHKASSDGGTTQPSTPTSNANVPVSGNNQGGFLGALNRIAQEQTLKSIVTLLSKGIKTTSDKKSEDTSRITSSEAYDRLMKYASAKYPYITKNSDTVKSNKSGYSMDIMRPKNLKEIVALEERINQLNAEGKAQTQEWAEAQARLNALKKEQEKITLTISADGKTITEKSGLQNLAVGAKAAMKELQNVDATMSRIQEAGLMSISPNGDITSSSSVVQNYLKILKDLQMYTDSLSSKELFDPSTNQKLNDLALVTQKYRKEAIGLINDAEHLNSGVMAGKLTGGISGLDDSAIKKSMQDIISQSAHLEATFGKFKPILNEFGQTVSYQLSYTLRTGKREVQNMTAALNPLTGEIRVQKGAVESVSTSWDKFWGGFKGKFKAITQYIMSMGSIYRVLGIIRQGITYVREIDSALTELKKVTDETAAGYKNFLQDMSQTGAVIGATVTNLTKMASEWARLGYSMEESGKLARSTAILLNVSEFQDATAASEALISTMQAFGYAADESTHVVDVLNEVGNNYAVSSDGIATALQDSASALMEGGNSLEQAVALVAAANKVVQDPNSVGSALRTISLRLRGTSVKVLEEMGESTDGVVASVSKLQGKIKALSGIDILTDSGEYKDTYTILKEIGTVWEDMSDIDQAALLELMAGE